MQIRTAPAKKKRTGLIITLVVVGLLLVCGGGGFGAWYGFLGGDEVIAAWTEEPTTYPTSYTPSVPPVEPGGTYTEPVAGTDDLCHFIDTLPIGLILYTDNEIEPDTTEAADSVIYDCEIPLYNKALNPENEAYGYFELSLQYFEDTARPQEVMESDAAGPFADSTPVAVDGLKITAQAFEQPVSDALGREIVLQAADGNVLAAVHWTLSGPDMPDVAPEVLVGIGVDTVNDVLAQLTA